MKFTRWQLVTLVIMYGLYLGCLGVIIFSVMVALA